MELITGKSAVRLYDAHFFRPLGCGETACSNPSCNAADVRERASMLT